MSADMPPHSAGAEEAVIGGLLVDTAAMPQVADVVRAGDFFLAQNRLIFSAALRVDQGGDDADLMTVMESLRQSGDLEDAGGTEYLGRLARDTPSAANIRAYAEIVRDRAIERDLIQAGVSFQRIVSEPGDVSSKLDQAQQSVLNIGRESGDGPRMVGDSMQAWVQQMDDRAHKGGEITGTPTGFADIDQMLGGFESGQLIIAAARPSMGKSALAINIADYIAEHTGTVAVFSLEMPSSDLIDRMVAARSGVSLASIRKGTLTADEWRQVTRASSEVNALPMLIDESGSLTVTDVRARARRIKQRHGLSLLVIDYLQLMSGHGENRNLEVGEISRGLKQLAKELEIPVVALSQLNRGLESRPDKRPRLSDLRESGSLEQDADVIAFIYRDEVYNEASQDRGTAEIIIGKQRNGPTGMVRMVYVGEQTRFRDCSHEDYDVLRRGNISTQAARRADDPVDAL